MREDVGMVSGVRWPPRARLGVIGLAFLAAGLSIALSVWVFPYHSVNHDEAVYLQQAAMLTEGRLFLDPPVPEAFRPWFFVRDGSRLYPKYAPVPAAMFALGEFAGGYRLALGAIAAAAVGLTYAVVAETFDRRRAMLAAGLLVASPIFLVQSAVFLPYLPTAALNLLFAFAYFRADRTRSHWWAALAGGAIGLSFFSRPYTAVLFAAPFVVHALWTLLDVDRSVLTRHAVTGTLGLVGVALALGYNAAVTGSPLLFPYEAFAPRDGLGFGRRAILGYSVEYTLDLAIRANAEVLWVFFTRWVVAGPVGTLLAVVGLGTFLARLRRPITPAAARRLVLAGLLVSVMAGNVYFWGNLNVLGDLSRPADGLVHYLGTYYHVDLLVPTVAFAAHGAFTLVDGGSRALDRTLPPDRAKRVGLAGLVVSAAILGGVTVVSAAGPVSDNEAVTSQLATAYEPLERSDLENALVFLPTPYGDWLNHPFQVLRNDPDYDGSVLYAIEDRQFAVVDAFPDRTFYRYSYRGVWAPFAGRSVEPRLQEVRVVEGEQVVLRIALGVPVGTERVSIRLATEDEAAYYVGVENASDQQITIHLRIGGGEARLKGGVSPTLDSRASVSVNGPDEVVLVVFAERGDGDGVTYRLRLPVDSGTTVRAITPHVEACLEPLRCGGEATYVPEAMPPGVSVESELSSSG